MRLLVLKGQRARGETSLSAARFAGTVGAGRFLTEPAADAGARGRLLRAAGAAPAHGECRGGGRGRSG